MTFVGALLNRVPTAAWIVLLASALLWGCHERDGHQRAQIDASAARTNLSDAEAAHAADRATAAQTAADLAKQALDDQQAHARRQTEILDALDAARAQNAALGRDRDDAARRIGRLRRDLAAAVAIRAGDRAQAGADAAAGRCARAAAELGDLLGQGVELAGEGADLVDELRAQLDAARAIVANDRSLSGGTGGQ